MVALKDFLVQCNLEGYAEAFEKEGVKDISTLAQMSNDELDRIFKNMEMKPDHKMKLIRAQDNKAQNDHAKTNAKSANTQQDSKTQIINAKISGASFSGTCCGVYKLKGVGAVVALNILGGELKRGDGIQFVKSNLEFEVTSIEMNQTEVQSAKKGDTVGIKLKSVTPGCSKLPKAGETVVLSAN
eukprot:jgi/Bigna1/75238/fgenesh1_pg.33_\